MGYVVWMLVAGPFSGVSNFIQTDAKTGVLEQLFLARRNFVLIATARSVAGIVVNLVGILIVLVVVLAVTSTSLNFRPSIIGPVLSAIVAAIGLGLCAASITLLAKKTQTLVGVATIGLLFLVMAPLENHLQSWAIVMLPLVPNTALLRDILVNGVQPSNQDIVVGALNSGAYYFLGCLALGWSIKKAKCDGKLAGY